MDKSIQTFYASLDESLFGCGDIDEAYQEIMENRPFDDATATAKECNNEIECFIADNPTIEIQSCEFTQKPASYYFQTEYIVEKAQEHAFDITRAEDMDWLDGLTENQNADLKSMFEKTFDEWATKHNLHPNFWQLHGNEQTHIVKPISETEFELAVDDG